MSNTPEQDFIEARESFIFMRRHPEYNPCDANSQILSEFIRANNLEWTQQSLEKAWESERGKMAPAEKESSSARVTEPTKEVDPFESYPLPAEVLAETGDVRTKKQIYAIPQEIYRKWYHHKGNAGVQFRARVNFIGSGGKQ